MVVLKKRSGIWILTLCLIFTTVGAVSAASATDIKGHWAEGTITSWIDQRLAVGYEDGTFRPDGKVNRQEFTALVNSSFGFVEPGTIQFTDVTRTDWSYSAISIAVKAGYVSGYPDGTFKPKRELSRQEVAVIIANVLGLKTSAASNLYLDANGIPAWSKGAIGAVKDLAIMGGYPDGTFRPFQTTTRAEAIVILDRALIVKAAQDADTAPEIEVPTKPTLDSATVAAGANVTISAPKSGVTAWLAPAGTTVFSAGANMTSLVGNGTATMIAAPTTLGDYKLFLVNASGASLASEGTLTVGLVPVVPAP
jgi:hypothetical protein